MKSESLRCYGHNFSSSLYVDVFSKLEDLLCDIQKGTYVEVESALYVDLGLDDATHQKIADDANKIIMDLWKNFLNTNNVTLNKRPGFSFARCRVKKCRVSTF